MSSVWLRTRTLRRTGSGGGPLDPADVIIQTSDNAQSVINANPFTGYIFEFAAGVHSRPSKILASANNQTLRGVTDGVPYVLSPTGIGGASLGKSKELWPYGTPITIFDGGGGSGRPFWEDDNDAHRENITVSNIKFQNYDPGNPPGGVVGNVRTRYWNVYENWFIGMMDPVRLGLGTYMARNMIDSPRVSWVGATYNQATIPSGTPTNPVIIEDNYAFDVNVTEEGNASNTYGDPTWHGGMKLLSIRHVIFRRNYVKNCHGPGFWVDWNNDGIDIYDNIFMDCGLHNDGGQMPHIFIEANALHLGTRIHNNWMLGKNARCANNDSHGNGLSTLYAFYENTVDADDGDRIGHSIHDGGRSGGDSTAGHPVINTASLPNGYWFADWVKVYDNVIRKRNSAVSGAIPIMGMQAGGAPDYARNYEFSGNKYELHSAHTAPFRWDNAFINFAAWQAKRAAANNVQNTGPFFDASGSYVTWNGSKQFADTTCNWENG